MVDIHCSEQTGFAECRLCNRFLHGYFVGRSSSALQSELMDEKTSFQKRLFIDSPFQIYIGRIKLTETVRYVGTGLEISERRLCSEPYVGDCHAGLEIIVLWQICRRVKQRAARGRYLECCFFVSACFG